VMRIVLDTNVLVSALLTPCGHASRIFDGFVTGQLFLFYDARVMLEYEGVLKRPKFGFAMTHVGQVLDLIVRQGEGIIPKRLSWAMPDDGDLPFYEVAFAAEAYLISGNKRHFPEDAFVKSPKEFCDLWPLDIGVPEGRG